MNLEYVVLAAPRSGTATLAEALSQAGLDCGHEERFGLSVQQVAHRGEASWLALPRVETGLVYWTPPHVFAQMRSPWDVISSVAAHLPQDPAYMKFALRSTLHPPRDIPTWAAAFVVDWMWRCLEVADAWWRVEDQLHGAVAEIAHALGEIPTTYVAGDPRNHRGPVPSIGPYQVDADVAVRVQDLAAHLGYA